MSCHLDGAVKPKKVFSNFVLFPIFFAGSVALSIYLTINLYLKFGWVLAFAFIFFLCVITLIERIYNADTWNRKSDKKWRKNGEVYHSSHKDEKSSHRLGAFLPTRVRYYADLCKESAGSLCYLSFRTYLRVFRHKDAGDEVIRLSI